MERSLEQDSIRFERSAEMLRESQSNQTEQTNVIFAGFKDIFKHLVSKYINACIRCVTEKEDSSTAYCQ